MPAKINLQAAFEIEQPIQAAEGETKLPRFKMFANSGKVPMRLMGWYDPVVVDLKGAKFAQKVLPILIDHNPTARFGHTDQQTIDAEKGIFVAGVVSSSSPEATTLVTDMGNGFPFQASIGADPIKTEFIEKGQSVTVNGTTFQGPINVVRKSSIYEVSVVALGGDNKTYTLAAKKGKLTMNPKFQAWVTPLLAAMCSEWDSLTEEQQSKLQAEFDRQNKVEPIKAELADDPAKELAESRKLRAAESRRTGAIEQIAASYASQKLNTDYLKKHKLPESLGELQATAIEQNWTPDQLEVHLLRAARPVVNTAIHVADRNVNCEAMEVALLRSFGSSVPISAKHSTGRKYGLEHWYKEETLEASHAPQYRGVCLHSLMDNTIRASGEQYHGTRRSDDFIKAFFHANQKLQATGFSNMAASTLLENVAQKMLLSMYEAQNTVWDQFCGVVPANDFKAVSIYRLTVKGGYSPVPATGELQHGTMTNDKYTVQADTYGKLVALSRRDMINDDLNAFAAIPQSLGREAALAIEELVFMQLLANRATLFTAGQGNYISGASSDLTVDGYTLAFKSFANLVDGDNAPILQVPDRVLVGTQDAVIAGEIFTEKMLETGITGGTKTRPAGNPHVGKLRPIVSPYLNNTLIKQRVNNVGTAITNQDSDQWYVFSDPTYGAVINVAFLNGNRVPTIEFSEADFSTLGMQWRSFHDFGVASGDPKMGLWAAGA